MERDHKQPELVEEFEWLGLHVNDHKRRIAVVVLTLWVFLLSVVCIWHSLEIYRLTARVNNLEAAGYPVVPAKSGNK